MKKNIIAIILLTVCVIAKAQYFIPVFDNTLNKANYAGGLLADTVHNFLYISVGYHNSSVDTSRLIAYRNNKFEQVGPTTNYDIYAMGVCLSSGKCLYTTGYGIDNYFNTLDSLGFSSCFGNTCYEPGGDIYSLKSKNDSIYIGGDIGKFQNTNSYDIGGMDSSGNTFTLGFGVTSIGGIRAMEFYNGKLYVGGTFTEMNTLSAKGIAMWDGFAWHPVSTGIGPLDLVGQSYIEVMKGYKNKLYVGGAFDSAGGVFCNGIARWTGSKWESVPEFDTMEISHYYDMKIFHNKLYVTGSFVSKGATYASGFLQYDGITFKHFEIGDKLVSKNQTMEVFNDTLYIAGIFDSLGYVPAKRLVKFVDGTFSTYAPVTTKWWYNSSTDGQQQPNSCYKYYEVARDTFVMNTPPTSGYNCRKIKAEQYLPDKTHTPLQPLYVFGDTNRIMYYNNYQKRFVVGYQFNVKVGDTLTYYTPQPQNAGDTTFRVIVDSVTTLTVQTEKLKRVYTTPLDGWSFGNDGYAQLIGGLASMLPQPISYFTNEGPLLCYQDTSIYFKYFTGGISCDVLTAIVEEQKQKEIFSISPNPVKESITVTSKENIQGIELFSILGTQLIEQSYSSSQKEIVFHTKDLPSGIYFLRVKLKNGWQVGKLVKE